jgi:hypothetical protein
MRPYAKFYSGKIQIAAISGLVLFALATTTAPDQARAQSHFDCAGINTVAALKLQSCTEYADVWRQIAVDRDRDVVRDDLGADLLEACPGEIEEVYNDPKFAALTPIEIGAAMLIGCRQLRRECKRQIDAAIRKANQTASGDTGSAG